jgi:hypothetical protein
MATLEQRQQIAREAIAQVDALTIALERIKENEDDGIVQGMLDSLLEQLEDGRAELISYREALEH